MATQDTKSGAPQNQQSQGQAASRGSQQQGISRRGGYGFGFPISPADFFRMDPFSLMRRMREEFDRSFGQWGGREQDVWSPAIEVTQNEGNYTVRAELPGLKPEDVKLEVSDDEICIQGERKSEHDETKGGVHMSERRYGTFYRTIPLPENAKGDQAKATFQNGVLEITVPADNQRNQRRRIPIQGAAPGSTSQPAGGSQKAA
jgi:HSP20 family protein